MTSLLIKKDEIAWNWDLDILFYFFFKSTSWYVCVSSENFYQGKKLEFGFARSPPKVPLATCVWGRKLRKLLLMDSLSCFPFHGAWSGSRGLLVLSPHLPQTYTLRNSPPLPHLFPYSSSSILPAQSWQNRSMGFVCWFHWLVI